MNDIQSTSRSVGFIGVGNIGQPMALALLDAGFDVSVYDVRQEAMSDCVEAGARPAGTSGEVAERADVIAVVVGDDKQVTEVLAGHDGVFEHARGDAVVLIHSTILPWTAQAMAESAVEQRVHVLDAPISGGAGAARRGALSVMVGGAEDDLERCRDVLDALGTTFHLGPTGAGAAGKLANQLMTFCNQLGAVEAMRIARHYGISEPAMAEAAQGGTADSWIVRNWGFFDDIVGQYDAGGTPERYRPWSKDLWDVTVVARHAELSLPMAGLAAQLGSRVFRDRQAEIKELDTS